MKNTLLVFTFVVLLSYWSLAEARKTYEGHQVIRLSFSGNKATVQRDMAVAYDIAKKHKLDVWASNKVKGWMDVMLPPQLTSQSRALFPNFRFVVKIPDVQQQIDENDRQRAVSDKPDDIFSNFQPYSAISDWMTQQQKQQPTLAQKFTLGQSYENNDIYGLILGPGSKPVVYIECGIHAREWIAPTHCLWFIDQILNQDPDRAQLLNNFTFAIIPVLNVDGYLYTFASDGDRMWRKNRQPNSGSDCVGTDLNRNWGYQWAGGDDPCDDTYPGTSAWTGPETALVRNFLGNTSKLVSFWDLHSYGGLWMSPWAYTCDQKPKDYSVMLAEMTAAAAAVQAVNGNSYSFGDVCDTIYQASGSTVDYTYGTGSVIHSFATESEGDSFVVPVSDIVPISTEIWAGMKTTLQLIANGQK